jgi:hypothetical protein
VDLLSYGTLGRKAESKGTGYVGALDSTGLRRWINGRVLDLDGGFCSGI